MTEPIPQRIGRAERDAATTQLRGQFEAGKLTQAEFGERAAAIAEAKYQADLDVQFADIGGLNTWKTLPRPNEPAFPGQEVAPEPTFGHSATPPTYAAASLPVPKPEVTTVGRLAQVVSGVIWPVMILLAFTGVIAWWPAIVTAICVSIAAGVIQSNFGTK